MKRPGKPVSELRDRAARRVDLDRHRDGVAVVLDQEDDRQLEVAGGVERLPELALAGGAVAGGAEHDLVALDGLVAVGDALDLRVAEPRLGAADGLEELGAGGARGADDVERPCGPSATASAGRRSWDRRPRRRRRAAARWRSCRGRGRGRGRGSRCRTSRRPGRSTLAAATSTASWPAPEIWKKILFCRLSWISLSSIRRDSSIRR